MDAGVTLIVRTARLTLREPRSGARVVMGWPLSLGERWLFLALIAVMSALLAELLLALSPQGADTAMVALLSSPITFAGLQFAALGILTGLLFFLGLPFGGKGRFGEALALVGWLQTLLLALQIAQIVAMVIFPVLGVLIVAVGLVMTLWLLTNFTAELHQFQSLAWTLFGIIAAFVALVVGLSVGIIMIAGVRV